jgi:hypothetical protein
MLSRTELHEIISKSEKAGLAVGLPGGFFFGVAVVSVAKLAFNVEFPWMLLGLSAAAVPAASIWRQKRLAQLRSRPLE